jgi:hypothetical protein
MKSGRVREFEWNHVLILVKALFTMGLLFYPVWWIHVHLVAGRLPTLPLSLAVSFLGVQILVVLVQVLASSATKKLDAMERRRSTHFRSVVQRALAAQHPDLAKLRRRRPADFDWSIAALLSNLTGPERAALSKLAVRLGVVRRWQRFARRGRREYKHALEWMAALSPEVARTALPPVIRRWTPESQAAAYRALVRSSDPPQAAILFREVLRAPFMVRILLTPEFRPLAEDLAAHPLPVIFESGEESEIICALEMIASWRRVLELPALPRLFHHSNAKIRCLAIQITPLSAMRGHLESYILSALEDPIPEVRMAALSSVASMRLRGAFDAVQRTAYSPDDALSRQACLTLASFGRDGQASLEYLVVAGDRRVAGWAAEGLARLRLGRGLAQELETYA